MTNEIQAVLIEASKIIKNGWCQGDFSKIKFGVRCYCVAGAISQATCNVIADVWYRDKIRADAILIAETAVMGLGFANIAAWNDHPSQKQSEVVALLESVASQFNPPGWQSVEV